MTLEQVKSFMRNVGWGILATSDGKTVGARPMGSCVWFGTEIWVASDASSDKVAQLAKVPVAEYCFSKPDGEHLRVTGSCVISRDNGDKRELYDAVPLLKNYIDDPASPDYVVIRMTPTLIRYSRLEDLAYTEVPLA